MLFFAFVYMATVAVGLTAAGLIRSGWHLATGEVLVYRLPQEPGLLLPLRSLAGALAGPVQLLFFSLRRLEVSPVQSALLIALSLLWSFFEGVFILTQVFGLS